jgi:hypothetical protein
LPEIHCCEKCNDKYFRTEAYALLFLIFSPFSLHRMKWYQMIRPHDDVSYNKTLIIISFSFLLSYYCCTWGTLWHLQKFLQYIIVEPPLHHSPLYTLSRHNELWHKKCPILRVSNYQTGHRCSLHTVGGLIDNMENVHQFWYFMTSTMYSVFSVLLCTYVNLLCFQSYVFFWFCADSVSSLVLYFLSIFIWPLCRHFCLIRYTWLIY